MTWFIGLSSKTNLHLIDQFGITGGDFKIVCFTFFNSNQCTLKHRFFFWNNDLLSGTLVLIWKLSFLVSSLKYKTFSLFFDVFMPSFNYKLNKTVNIEQPCVAAMFIALETISSDVFLTYIKIIIHVFITSVRSFQSLSYPLSSKVWP